MNSRSFLRGSRGAFLLAAAATLSACGTTDPGATAKAEQTVSIRFAAMTGTEPVRCGKTISGLGKPASSAELRDLRFYVSDVALIDEAGRPEPLRLTPGEWQRGQVALIDLADGQGACATAGSQTNPEITGTLPAGRYRGLRFTVGVPHNLNHSDYASADPPLDVQAMAWAWQVGRKFMQFEINPVGGVVRTTSGAAPGRSFLFHLGTTGCRGNPVSGETVHCERSNRAEVVLGSFDASVDQVAIDLAELFAGNDVGRDGGGALGCMSALSDPECAPLFAALGIDMASGKSSPQSTDARRSGVFRALSK
ncbi:MbnP family copper-binding protein [Acidovorax sp. SDU_ACID1]|uniref:MbnP family copper-binding protein n=1 Tax=Acidovorax sp. SDU_ACID1 TaxID=3136632 RepID=UPI003873A9AE